MLTLSGTPKSRTDESPLATGCLRKSTTEEVPHRETPGNAAISCLKLERICAKTGCDFDLMGERRVLSANLASGDSSVIKRGSMKLCGCSSVPELCHWRMVEFL